MHEALHRGEPTASCVVQVRSPQGGYRWERIHYTTLFDDRRRPVWAVAIVEDVSDQKYAERRCMQEEQLREMLSVDVLISGKVNLTKNQVEELWGHRSFPAAFQKVQDCDGLFQLMGEYLATRGAQAVPGALPPAGPAGQVPGGGPGNLGGVPVREL